MKQPNLRLTYLIQDLARKLRVPKERILEEASHLAELEERDMMLRRHIVDAANNILQEK